jgi:hypothetical protein
MTSPSCSGACAAGHACPSNSSSPTAVPCPPGSYALPGAAACTLCPAGSFGASFAEGSSDCSGPCPPGHYCPPGTSNSTALPCPPGTYCPAGAAAPLPCAPGYFGNSSGAGTPQCAGMCPRGHYCAGGVAAPAPCGNATVFCPAGSASPYLVDVGFYSVPGTATSEAQDECPAGSVCVLGVRLGCPAGTFSGGTRQANLTDCRTCTAGGFCPSGSAAPLPCGSASVYCVAGSAAPAVAGEGYYTVGSPGARVDRVLCEPGFFCPGDGLRLPCPASRYGSTSGLTHSNCSGGCDDGGLCLEGATSPAGEPCPLGSYCHQGTAFLCPAGTYNPNRGAADVSQCLACPSNTYNADSGSVSLAQCGRCPAFEGSDVGAVTCWPGIMGA